MRSGHCLDGQIVACDVMKLHGCFGEQNRGLFSVHGNVKTIYFILYTAQNYGVNTKYLQYTYTLQSYYLFPELRKNVFGWT